MTGGHEHIWSKSGLWIDGEICLPCLVGDCDCALCGRGTSAEVFHSTKHVREGVFPPVVDGMRLDLEDDPKGGVIKFVLYEVADSYLLTKLEFAPGDVILDIGAHVGAVSVYLGKKWPQTRIHAFEPMPENLKRLARNLEVNAVQNVTIYPWALAAQSGIITLRGNALSNTGGYSAFVRAYEGQQGMRVRAITLARAFELVGAERVKLLKIDCEGAEYEVLGADESLLDRVDYLVGEIHINQTLWAQGHRPEGLVALLERHIPPDHTHMITCRMGE